MSQELNRECAICLVLGDICVTCEEQTAALVPAGVKLVVHRYRVVKILSEDGNKIDYKPHGPSVVMADVHDAHVTRLQAENAALQQRLNVADQRVDYLEAELTKAWELLPEMRRQFERANFVRLGKLINEALAHQSAPAVSPTNNSGKAHCPHCGICHTSDETCKEAVSRIDSLSAPAAKGESDE
jgi:hypothetical protein